jgi:hypothetical protein
MLIKLRLGFHLKLYKKGELVVDTRLRMKTRVDDRVKVALWDKGYLKVTYKPGVFNEIDFKNYADFRKALTIFTEHQLVKYLQS